MADDKEPKDEYAERAAALKRRASEAKAEDDQHARDMRERQARVGGAMVIFFTPN